MRRDLALALALALTLGSGFGCRASSEDADALLYPPLASPPTDVGPDAEPHELIDGPLSARKLQVVLPPLKRRTGYTWKQQNTLVQGHFSARLTTRDKKKPMLLVTVDDYIDQPERNEVLRKSTARRQRFPSLIHSGVYIKVLVADRFRVEVRAIDPTFANSDKLELWLEKLKLKALKKLVELPDDPKKKKKKRR